MNPILLHVPLSRAGTGDFCFRNIQYFTDEKLLKHCMDAMLSKFSYPADPFDTNEIYLFINKELESVADATQVSYTVTLLNKTIFCQFFGVWDSKSSPKILQFIDNVFSSKNIQTSIGIICKA